MKNELEILRKLNTWLNDKYFKSQYVLIKEEVKFKISEFKLSADLIAIQSKSNIIHGFEIKGKLRAESVLSAIWQANSYYTNYKWLVIKEIDKELLKKYLTEEKLLNVGLILYDELKDDFSIWHKAKYIDGNFLKYMPELESQWHSINKSEKR